jgi:hypothetical protein
MLRIPKTVSDAGRPADAASGTAGGADGER